MRSGAASATTRMSAAGAPTSNAACAASAKPASAAVPCTTGREGAARPLASALHRDRIGAKIRAQDVAETRKLPGSARQRRAPGDWRALLARKREGDIRPAHGKTARHVADRLGLGAVGLEKFQPR